MRTCPKCGYVDPAHREGDRKYEKKRGSRAAYMRKYRAKRKRDAAKAAQERKP